MNNVPPEVEQEFEEALEAEAVEWEEAMAEELGFIFISPERA